MTTKIKASLNSAIRTVRPNHPIGCVYPFNENSYYIDSNIQQQLVEVGCADGSFYTTLDAEAELIEKYGTK